VVSRSAWAEVRDPGELLALGTDAGQRFLERLLLAPKLADPFGHQLRLDPSLERLDLGPDLALELGDLLAHPGSGELAVSPLLAIVGAKLLAEPIQSKNAKGAG